MKELLEAIRFQAEKLARSAQEIEKVLLVLEDCDDLTIDINTSGGHFQMKGIRSRRLLKQAAAQGIDEGREELLCVMRQLGSLQAKLETQPSQHEMITTLAE